MNSTKTMIKLIALSTFLAFSGNARATFDITAEVGTRLTDPVAVANWNSNNGNGCIFCHTIDFPDALNLTITNPSLKPNILDAYNADRVNFTGLVNLVGCPAGTTANANQPWVCEGGAPNPTPTPTPTPPTACDDAANTATCSGLTNQYGTVGSSENGEEVTDTYKVKCGKKTKALKVSVSDLAPDNAANISIQAFKGKLKSRISTDTVDGDDVFSNPVRLAQGSGNYTVKVKKSKSDTAGAEIYDAQIMCVGSKQAPARSTITIKQNQ